MDPITIELKYIINKIEDLENKLKAKQQILIEMENNKQQIMVEIFQMQGAIQALKDLKSENEIPFHSKAGKQKCA